MNTYKAIIVNAADTDKIGKEKHRFVALDLSNDDLARLSPLAVGTLLLNAVNDLKAAEAVSA